METTAEETKALNIHLLLFGPLYFGLMVLRAAPLYAATYEPVALAFQMYEECCVKIILNLLQKLAVLELEWLTLTKQVFSFSYAFKWL